MCDVFYLIQEEPVRVKYKTEYRKTNRASTMLICDKVKLPLAKPRKTPQLVDISDGPPSTSNKNPSTMERRTRQINTPPDGAGKSTKFKIKLKRKEVKKVGRKRKVAFVKKAKSGNGVSGSKGKKISNLKPTNTTANRTKSVGSEQLRSLLSEGTIFVTQPKKQKAKKKPTLTPEKILYNKLTEVMKDVAEPNIFSPRILPPDLEIKCSNCGEEYPDRKSLWDHIQCHLKKPVPFRLSKYYRFCRICKKYVSEIRDHVRACHFDGGTPYGCDFCPAKFRYKGLLRNHVTNRHTTARNHMCEICGMAFKQSVTLKKHKLVHTDEKNFFCSTCGKAFKTLYGLQKHSVVHALVKPYTCEICNKGFTQQTNMKSHQRTHTGEKPYKCDLCMMAFTHNVSLKTHKKKYHDVDMWANAPMPPEIIPSPQGIQLPFDDIQLPKQQQGNVDNVTDDNQELDVWFPQPSNQLAEPISQSNTQLSSQSSSQLTEQISRSNTQPSKPVD